MRNLSGCENALDIIHLFPDSSGIAFINWLESYGKIIEVKPVPKPKVFVASTVYNFEDQLQQICGVLTGFGFEVWNSHLGTVPINPACSNRDNCIAAVGDCDLFLGIIRPFTEAALLGRARLPTTSFSRRYT